MSCNTMLSPHARAMKCVFRATQIMRFSNSPFFMLHAQRRPSRKLDHRNEIILLKQRTTLQSNKYVIRNCSTGSNTYDMEEKHMEETESDADSTNLVLKTMLYDESDEIMKLLNQSSNLNQLLNTIEENENFLTLQHRVQSVILLWMLHQQNQGNFSSSEIVNTLHHVSKGLQPHVDSLDISELSCCYLYLRKLHMPNTDEVMRDLLINALKKTKEIPLVPLPSLSRLSIAINTGYDFHIPTVCASFIPHILIHLEKCYTQEEARLVAICMHNLHQLIDQEILGNFKERTQELLDANVINAHTPKAIMKLLHLFNLPTWSQHNALVIRNLLLSLREEISNFSEGDLKIACRVFQHHLEPAVVESSLKSAIEKQLKRSPAVDTLVSYMPFTEATKREPLIAMFKQFLYSKEQWQTQYASVNFFHILRSLKVAETKVCDSYWKTILKNLEDSSSEEKHNHNFLRHCHRYMHFNNNLGGTYRYLPLESKLSKMCMDAIENDLGGSIPWKFARLASFIIAYGHTPYGWKKFPNTLLSKIISMSDQFSPLDCFYISRGVQICMEMRFRFHVPSTLGMQLATIDDILKSCVERHLQSIQPLSIDRLNTLVRTMNNRKSLKNSLVYQQVMNQYKNVDYSNLNSRRIRDLAYIFTASNYIEPKALNVMFDYIEKEHEHILGDTVEKVLTCAYNLGFTPESFEVFDCAARVLIRDFDFMSGLSLVQACLALCFYKTIPDDLINKIFCVNFIKRIEDEIHLCYSKATYPERVQNMLMQLNRTVCLDFPEANVPWFQQSYIEAQLTKKPVLQNRFSHEVHDLLGNLLKDDTYFHCNHTTPYGYQIDFVIHFDKNQKPIKAPVATTMLDRITKVAILLLKLNSFCENDLSMLRGPESLKMKHLEMMGYKVIHINEHDWNSKYMNAPGAKTNYLKCLLKITS